MQQYNNRRQIRETRRTQTQPEQGSSRGDQAAERQRYLTEYAEEPIRSYSREVAGSANKRIARGPRSSHDMNKRGTYVIHEALDYVIRIDKLEKSETSHTQYMVQTLGIMDKVAPNSTPSKGTMKADMKRARDNPNYDRNTGNGWTIRVVE